MRKNVLWISVLAVAILSACTTKENNEKPIMTPTSTPTATAAPTETPLPTSMNTPIVSPTPTEEEVVVAYLNSFDRIDCTDIESYVNKEDSIRNSNLLNYGFLTYDSEGNIYYVNENDSKIYRSDGRGGTSN